MKQVVGRQDTNTQFLYREAKVTVTEADPLMKGKDVKIVVLAPFYEIIRTYELVTAAGRDVEAEMKKANAFFPNFTPVDLAVMKESRIRQGAIIAGQANPKLTPSTTRYWYMEAPRAAIYTRTPTPGQ